MQIASFFGIPLYLHWSWFLLVAIIGILNGPVSMLVILGVFLLVVLHEYGHCFAARCYGLEVAYVTLYPVGGIARIPSLGEQSPWKRELVIALAGPLVNIILCAIATITISVLPESELVKDANEATILGTVLFYVIVLNAGLAIFNLLPIFPMDGGRVLRAGLFGVMQDYERSTEIAVRIGQVLACGMIFLGILSGNPLMAFIFFLVCMGAQGELLLVKRQASLERLKEYLAQELDRPEVVSATLPQVIAILEDVKDEDLRKGLTLDELLPLLKQHLESQQNRQSS